MGLLLAMQTHLGSHKYRLPSALLGLGHERIQGLCANSLATLAAASAGAVVHALLGFEHLVRDTVHMYACVLLDSQS